MFAGQSDGHLQLGYFVPYCASKLSRSSTFTLFDLSFFTSPTHVIGAQFAGSCPPPELPVLGTLKVSICPCLQWLPT